MKRINFSRYLVLAAIIIVTIIALFPFYLMIIMSTYYTNELYMSFRLLPGKYLMDNLKTVMSNGFVTFYWNSFYIAACSTVLTVFFSALAGFAFSKYEFKGKSCMMTFILVTMMIPSGLGIIGFVREMKAFNWLNTHLPVIIPSIASAYGVFLMTQFMKSSVHGEILESARVDGCNEFRTFMQIVMPLIKPVIASLGIFTFVWSWNSFMTPLILFSKIELYTVPLGIVSLGSLYRQDLAARILALTIGTLPILIIFIANSSAFLRGMTTGAVKG